MIFCCSEGDELVGAVVYSQSEHGGGTLAGPVTIGMLSVLPSHQRRGIARALVAECEARAAEEGRTAVHAHVINLQDHLKTVTSSVPPCPRAAAWPHVPVH